MTPKAKPGDLIRITNTSVNDLPVRLHDQTFRVTTVRNADHHCYFYDDEGTHWRVAPEAFNRVGGSGIAGAVLRVPGYLWRGYWSSVKQSLRPAWNNVCLGAAGITTAALVWALVYRVNWSGFGNLFH